MKKLLMSFLLIACLSIASTPIPTHAATQAEKLLLIESLTKLLILLQEQLKMINEENNRVVSSSKLQFNIINISNPTSNKYINGVMTASNGDRIGISLKEGDISFCSLNNPSKDFLRAAGPFDSSETDSKIFEIDLPFSGPSKMYEVGISCKQKSGVVSGVARIDFVYR